VATYVAPTVTTPVKTSDAVQALVPTHLLLALGSAMAGLMVTV
jgi:hypothetical protein